MAFASEERGLIGSYLYVKKMTTEQKAQTRAFVNLECLGLGRVNVWVSRSAPSLVARLMEVSKAVDIPLQGVNVDNVGDDDTHPFFSAHIPVICIHSITQETFGILHSERDQVSAIQFDALLHGL